MVEFIMSKYTLLIALLVGCVTQFKCSHARQNELIKYLEANVLDASPRADVQAANKWLGERPLDEDFREDLKEFADLIKLENDECNMDSFEILANLVGYPEPISMERLANRGRVGQDVHFYAKRHAENCIQVYPRLYEQKVATLDQNVMAQVERLANELLSRLSDDNTPRVQKILIGFEYLNSLKKFKELSQSILAAIRAEAENDPELSCLLAAIKPKWTFGRRSTKSDNKNKARNLFNKYTIEPCEYYMDRLMDVFIPANYDEHIIPIEERTHFHEENFYFGWFEYKICDRLVNGDSNAVFAGLMDSVDKN